MVYVTSATLLSTLLMAGCAATGERSPGRPAQSGFLGDDSQLAKNPDYPASVVYVKPGVPWVIYRSIKLDYAGLWLSEQAASISPADRQMLTDMLYTSLHDALAPYFTLVDRVSPDTLRLRAALTQAPGANVAPRAVTTAMPQLRLPGAAVGLAADTAATVGSAGIEMEVLDSVTNERLAAAVDERAGTKAFFPRRSYRTWGDVEAACDYWSKRIARRLAQAGVQPKTDAKTPEEPEQSFSF